MKKSIYIFFISIFLLLLILVFKSIVFYSFSTRNIYNIVLIIFLILLILFLYKKNHIKLERIKFKYIFLILIFLGIGLRLLLLLNTYNYPQSDYQTFYENAIAVSTNIDDINSRYISIFPHIGGYIVFLGNIFKLFGSSYNVYIITNIIFDLIGGIFLYKTLENLSSKKAGLIGLTIWMICPINIIWCAFCSPVIIFNSLLNVAFFITSLIIKCDSNNKKKFLTLNLILGFSLGIANIFRPIMIIYIIAIFIYYLYILIFNNKNVLIYLFAFTLIFIPYFVVNNINNLSTTNLINEEITSNSVGWNLYIGSNISSRGMWYKEASILFREKSYNYSLSATDIQNYFMKLGLQRYEDNGLDNLKLLDSKFNAFHERIGSYAYNSYFDILNIKNSNIINLMVMLVTNSFYYLLVIISIFSFKTLYNDKNSKYLICILFFMGVIISHLVMEASPRYMLPLLNVYILISALWLNKYIKVKLD